jgi:ATP-dependent helicase/nuclease subunit B
VPAPPFFYDKTGNILIKLFTGFDMAVQFILGRSGTGKTTFCVNAIVESLLEKSDRSLIFLVPEQATYQAGRAVLNDPRIAGFNRLHVLSFDRLIFLVSGKNAARPAISRLGRSMVIQRILRDCADKLKIFGSSIGPGLGLRLSETIAQLQQYANTPDDVENLVKKLKKETSDNLTAAKFADIAIVFEQYLNFIKGKFLDPDIQLADACKTIAKTAFLKGANLWVDGFAGFTTSELAVLTELLKVVDSAQIALCLDPSIADITSPDINKIDPADLFSPTLQTYCKLVERIKKSKISLAKPLILDKSQRLRKSPPLAYIEQNIFSSTPGQSKKAEGKIRLVCAPNARAEVQFVAQQITKLVRTAGWRYRDIAVIASDIDSYEHYIKAGFEDYSIPVFIDKRKSLNQHPAIELIGAALSAVTNNFPSDEIFAYLKTDLLDITRRDVDLLENYCVAFGVTGGDWIAESPWRFAADRAELFEEPRVDRIRKKVTSPLAQLKKQIADTSGNGVLTAKHFTKIIFDFLESADVGKHLALWVEQALQKGDFVAADEHRQLFDRLVDIFDEMTEAFSGVSMSCADFLAIISSAFSQMTLAFIPPNLDQVLVGSIERSRHPDLKAVFLIGVTEKEFPSPVAFDSILSEDDRLVATESGLELSPGVRQELANRPYLAYIAFTRASELLVITYPALDGKSNAVVRSAFLDNLSQLFEDLEEETIFSVEPAFENIFSQYDLEDHFCSTKDESLSSLVPRVANAVNYENKAELNNNIVSEVFGTSLSSSASRLAAFASCPYKHFARHILKLQKREEFKLEPLDVGDFYHRALDGFLKRTVAEKINFETIAPAALLKILDEQIEKLCREDPFISKFKSRNPHNAFIIENCLDYLRDCVLALLQMIKMGGFRPVLSEIAFGKAESSGSRIGDFLITLDDGRRLSLNGRIDRLDIANVDSRKVAVVFDYKKRPETFSWSEFFHGLDLQLPVYLLAILNTAQARNIADDVAGAFYVPVEAAPASTPLGKLAENPSKFTHKAKGIFNGQYINLLDRSASGDNPFYNFYVTKEGQPYGKYGSLGALRPDDFESFLSFCTKKIAALATQIVSGKITVWPYRLGTDSPCSRCDYMPVCRFDWQINDFNVLSPLDKETVLDRIKQK